MFCFYVYFVLDISMDLHQLYEKISKYYIIRDVTILRIIFIYSSKSLGVYWKNKLYFINWICIGWKMYVYNAVLITPRAEQREEENEDCR